MDSDQLKETLDFWNPRDMTHAREMILAKEDWNKSTSDMVRLLLNGVRTGGTALEIGCGVGRLLMPMAYHFKQVVGLDIAPNMLALAQQYLDGLSNVKLALIENDKFVAADSSIDYVFSVTVFQHIFYRQVIQRYLAETRRVLRTSGTARIQTHKGDPGANKFHGYFYRSMEDFAAEFANAGLEVIDVLEVEEDEWLWVTARKMS